MSEPPLAELGLFLEDIHRTAINGIWKELQFLERY